MDRDWDVFIQKAPSYDEDSMFYIHADGSQNLEFPKEYPAIIQVHMEHPAMNVPTHWHPSPELIYSRNRELLVIIDGKKERVQPGEFALISSYGFHAVQPVPGDIRQDVLSITFQSRYLERMLPQLRSCVISRDAPGASDESRAQMVRYCEQLREHIEKHEDYFETNQILFSILQLIYRDFLVGTQDNEPKQLNMRSRMMEVLDYVEKNYRSPLTTQSVADHFGYTREYFCRLFRRYGNYTFKQYLTELRLGAVVQELSSSDQAVGQVAMNHGFPDEKSFFIAFKRKYGVTPVQYRRNSSAQS